MVRKTIICVAALLALSACDTRPETAEWQSVCVEDHLQMRTTPVSSYNPTTKIYSTTLQQQWIPVCDRYEKVCVPGRDGTVECPMSEN